MALSTYTELQASVADWLHRADLTTRIVDFIALAESDLNTEIRTHLMETDASLTLVSGTSTIALPTDFGEPIRLDLVFTGRANETLRYQTPNQMEIAAATGSTYQPQYWTINGDNIEFPNDADQNYSILFRYLAEFNLASTSTNSLLTKYPGLYLYGTLLQAAPFMQDDPRIPVWEAAYRKLLMKVNKNEARVRSLATLATEVSIRGSRTNNIFKG